MRIWRAVRKVVCAVLQYGDIAENDSFWFHELEMVFFRQRVRINYCFSDQRYAAEALISWVSVTGSSTTVVGSNCHEVRMKRVTSINPPT